MGAVVCHPSRQEEGARLSSSRGRRGHPSAHGAKVPGGGRRHPEAQGQDRLVLVFNPPTHEDAERGKGEESRRCTLPTSRIRATTTRSSIANGRARHIPTCRSTFGSLRRDDTPNRTCSIARPTSSRASSAARATVRASLPVVGLALTESRSRSAG